MNQFSAFKMVPMEMDEATEKEDFIHDPLARVEDEFDGWCNYKKMYKEHNQERYRIASKQEFGHLIMAVEDFLHEIQKHAPDAEEAAEFNKMLTAFTLRGI